MTCEECIKGLWPENPAVPQRYGLGYLRPLCEACPNYPPDKEEMIVYADMQWTNRQWDVIQQLRGQVAYLQSKYQEQLNERKQSGKLFIKKNS